MLDTFYALTKNEVYEVSSEKNGISPSVIKVFDFSTKQSFRASEILTGGNMVSVGRQIILYPKKEDREIEMVSWRFWGSGSSQIVALFERKDQAIAASKMSELKTPDPRWYEDTKIVLGKIGSDHPVFYIPFSANLVMVL